MRWQGFRKVRGRVCKRIDRRVRELGLADAAGYRAFLQENAHEWNVLDSLCRVTISRFYRDREVFLFLEREVLVRLAESARERGEKELRCWSIGCASGEEPYTLAILWKREVGRLFPELTIRILATDVDGNMIERAEKGCYSSGSLAGLPPEWKANAFDLRGGSYCIKAEEREKVSFLAQDIRRDAPEGLFHLVLLRNLAFTYFDTPLQQDVLFRVKGKLIPGGALVIGVHESLPAGACGLTAWPGIRSVFRIPRG
jgi:chemotaxis protein methyltransferase CheR